MSTFKDKYRQNVIIPVKNDALTHHNVPKSTNNNYVFRMNNTPIRRIYADGIASYGLSNYIKSIVNEVCVKIIFKNISTIYALIYINNYENGFKISNSYITIGGTYMSADGEYRKRFIQYVYYERLYDKYNEIFNIVEDELIHKMEAHEAIFNIVSCPVLSLNRDQEQQLYNLVENNRMPIILFVLTWFHDAYFLYNDIMTNHINPSFKLIMMDMITRKTYDLIIEKIGIEKYRDIVFELIYLLERSMPIMAVFTPGLIGHKRIPTTTADVRAIAERYPSTRIGRECQIGMRCSELVLNMISPSFPIVYNGFFTENTSAAIYDNPAMHRYYEVNLLCDELKKNLTQMRKMIRYGDADELKTNTMATLDELLYKAIQRIDISVITTDASYHWLQEHVGITFRDLPLMITSKSNLHFQNYAEILDNYEIFAKLLFDYIYAIYCMHSRVGVIHADLHLNNFTIHSTARYPRDANGKRTERYKMSYMLGILSDDETYMFSACDFIGCIIDFSRAYPLDIFHINPEVSNDPYMIDVAREFITSKRIPRDLITKFTSVFKLRITGYEFNIQRHLIADDENRRYMFKVLSLIDCFTIMENILLMIKTDEAINRGTVKCDSRILQLLADGLAACHNWFEDHKATLSEILLSQSKNKKLPNIDWPAHYVIGKMFAAWNVKNINMENRVSNDEVDGTRGVQIDDVYNYKNNITYTLKNPPPFANPKTYYPIISILLPDIADNPKNQVRELTKRLYHQTFESSKDIKM